MINVDPNFYQFNRVLLYLNYTRAQLDKDIIVGTFFKICFKYAFQNFNCDCFKFIFRFFTIAAGIFKA